MAVLSGNAILGVGGSRTRDVPDSVAGITLRGAAGTFAGERRPFTSFFKLGGLFVD